MSYQVLARKYRPANFQALEGQEHVLQALVNALDNNRLHHAYLFTGTRGVGKTTIARILAKCLNCEQGISAIPCETCPSCLEIAEGRSVDLIEYDAASRTKVEDTREILDNVQYMPTRSRFKVYLIDEVHMLSNHSFNALLKTLEEPPEHVKFLLATTDPKKLPITVLSRCLQFNLKNISPERVVSYLQTILAKEEIQYEENALWQLGRAADGSMRDALSLTDQAINFGNNAVRDEDVRQMLGSIDQQEVFGLLNCLVDGNAAALLDRVKALADFSPDYSALLAEMLSVLHRVAVAQTVPDAIDNSQGDQAQVMELAGNLSREATQLYYQIGLIGQRDLPLAPDARTGLEMTLLRILSFAPNVPVARIATTGEATEDPKKKDLSEPELTPLSPVSKVTNNSLESSTQAQPSVEPQRRIEPQRGIEPEQVASAKPSVPVNSPIKSVVAAAIEAPSPIAMKAMPERISKPAAAEEAEFEVATHFDLSPDAWTDVLSKLGLIGVTQSVAANSVVLSAAPEGCSMLLNEEFASLWNNTHQKRIETALRARYQNNMKVEFDTGKPQTPTPADIHAQRRAEAHQSAIALMQNDHNVRQLIDNFGGSLDIESINVRK